MRVKAVISYDGSRYQGFQKQKSTKLTITADIEEALSSLQIDSPIIGSGRTDAGVHATGQVIHFDLPDFWYDLEKLKHNVNRKLTDISFKHISVASNDFHARFSAKKRVYRYVFKTHKPSVFEQKYISYYKTFDPVVLINALKTFEGKHDFNFFHKTGTITHTTVREIYRTDYVERNGYHFIYFQANGFLRSQVRMMVDAAMLCARGELSLTQLQEQLQCQKKHTTRLAPPEGLYLARIIYK
ncbi:tRNA pseudouridine(38-40) synthase TruA [Sulfurovum sp. XGS-02]|uniref:tRNA pseudouridine(38-40) synthase TruA n=1 Tax=Sulfurovum sp. XGS-02 TaxID=2925411 RepID=UPI0020656A56|nr:tRNA pseudouridine(38-40) synthase TruA [Sulfurovum sp. XGS-02]UPT77064.1 tRNA pseudouridine(38-40) synthase TruA [Sulfurovum sp. XGS-02]